jgi:hypothetical protein
MKHRINAALVLLLTSGIGHAAPPTQLPPGFEAKLKKIMMEFPLTFACPVVKVQAFVAGLPPAWTGKTFLKTGVAAQAAYTQPGVTHDSCWCRYQVTSAEVPGSETDFLLEREGVNSKPICQVDSTAKSFTCYALKSGETY